MSHTNQAPDTQGNSKDGLAGSLTDGDSTTGMSGGSLGDLSASDVRRGYGHVSDPDAKDDSYQCNCEICTASRANKRQGFLGELDPYNER